MRAASYLRSFRVLGALGDPGDGTLLGAELLAALAGRFDEGWEFLHGLAFEIGDFRLQQGQLIRAPGEGGLRFGVGRTELSRIRKVVGVEGGQGWEMLWPDVRTDCPDAV